MKKIFYGLLAFVLCVGAATQRAGWSYSGSNTFKTSKPTTVRLYHNPSTSFPYDGKPENENPIFIMELEPGNYVLTIEGYYYMELEH
jgi:hypothetical protein